MDFALSNLRKQSRFINHLLTFIPIPNIGGIAIVHCTVIAIDKTGHSCIARVTRVTDRRREWCASQASRILYRTAIHIKCSCNQLVGAAICTYILPSLCGCGTARKLSYVCATTAATAVRHAITRPGTMRTGRTLSSWR